MTETKSERRPRRDPSGRLATFGDLLGVAFAGLVIGVVLLLAFEAVLALTRVATFGNTSGWLALVLPAWLFTEEFRKAGWGAYRIIVAALAAGFGVAFGMTAAGVAAPVLPSLASGFVGATACTVVYCLIWFYGLRWISHRSD